MKSHATMNSNFSGSLDNARESLRTAWSNFRYRWWALILFVSTIALFVWDHASDNHESAPLHHVVIELLMLLVAMACAAYLWSRLQQARQHERQLSKQLRLAEERVSRWQTEEHNLIQDLRKAIERQFAAWDFTDAEREIAWSLLRGMSMKDIASARDSTDRSIRQQAYVLYHKADLAGRAELSAFFLGGLIQSEHPAH